MSSHAFNNIRKLRIAQNNRIRRIFTLSYMQNVKGIIDIKQFFHLQKGNEQLKNNNVTLVST